MKYNCWFLRFDILKLKKYRSPKRFRSEIIKGYSYNTYKFISGVKLPNLVLLSGTRRHVQLKVFNMQSQQ